MNCVNYVYKSIFTERDLRRYRYFIVNRPSPANVSFKYFILANDAEAVYYPDHNVLNVLGTWAQDMGDRLMLITPEFNYSENLYIGGSITFVDGDFTLRSTECPSFKEFSLRVVMHVKNELTKTALEEL